MTRSRIFSGVLTSFILGILAASFAAIPIALLWFVFICGALSIVFSFIRSHVRVFHFAFGLFIVAAVFGSLWFLRAGGGPSDELRSLLGIERKVVGVITDESKRSERSTQFIVELEPSGDPILIITQPHSEYRYGMRVVLTGILEAPENFSPDFDYVSYLARSDIFALMRFPEIAVLDADSGSLIRRLLFTAKWRFRDAIESALPEPHASFLLGLLLGERETFPPELKENLTTTGTMHLTALSGYNISIIADSLLRFLWFFPIPSGVSLAAAAAGVALFVITTGGAASVVRAAIMGTMVLIARQFGRRSDATNALLLAAAVMLIHDPRLLRFDIGFQLSFAATIGLITLAPLFERGFARIRFQFFSSLRQKLSPRDRAELFRAWRTGTFVSAFIATLAAQAAVLPLIVYHFGSLSVISPVANVAVVPAIPLTMGTGFLAGFAGLFSETIGQIVGIIPRFLLGYELGVIEFFASLPFASVSVFGFGVGTLIIGYGILGAWIAFALRRHQPIERDEAETILPWGA